MSAGFMKPERMKRTKIIKNFGKFPANGGFPGGFLDIFFPHGIIESVVRE